MQVKHWLRIALSAMLVHVTVVCAQEPDIPLGTPDGFRADAINPVGNGRYCISGNIYDDTVPTRSAMVVLIDASNRRVVWRTAIPYGSGYVSNSAVACGSDGQSIYAVTEEQTQSAESLNQTSIAVNRISAAGKLEKHQPIRAGFDEWFYMLAVGPTGAQVVGGTSATLQRGGPFGTFVAQFDADLAQSSLTQLQSGAFWTDASARLDGQHLLVAGQFMPNAGAGHEGYAVSKIDLGKKRYVWSAYPLPGNVTSASAFLAPDGSVYDIGVTPTGVLSVATLSPAGKVTSMFSTKDRTLCGITALTSDSHTLKVIGDSCKGDNPVLVSVDLVSHAAGTTHSFTTGFNTIAFEGNNWIGVAKTDKQGPVFRRGEN